MLKCHLVKDPRFGYGEGLLSDPSFELKWQEPTGSVKPVILLSSRERHWAIGMRWNYFLELSSRDVPLTDNLLGDCRLGRVRHISGSPRAFMTMLSDTIGTDFLPSR